MRISAIQFRIGWCHFLLAAMAVLLLVSGAFAQSCSLCYTQAASAGSRLIHGLRSGILVLIIPPMCMSVGITVLAYKKRNQFNRQPRSTSNRTGSGW